MDEQRRIAKRGVAHQAQDFILVVDDDYDLRQMIQWMLEEEGFKVQTAGDGREAIELALLQQPALMLLDLGLPLLNGDAVAAQVYAHYGNLVPILLMTADRQVEEKSCQMGAVTYVRKPFDINDLLATVQHACEAGV
ncbi:MAG TPA: response regulator [Ktedonobacteraceae bacterium]